MPAPNGATLSARDLRTLLDEGYVEYIATGALRAKWWNTFDWSVQLDASARRLAALMPLEEQVR